MLTQCGGSDAFGRDGNANLQFKANCQPTRSLAGNAEPQVCPALRPTWPSLNRRDCLNELHGVALFAPPQRIVISSRTTINN